MFDVVRSLDSEPVFYESALHEKVSFVQMIQVNSDKTDPTLKANVILKYLVHIFFLNISNGYRSFFINHGRTVLSLLSVSTFVVCHEDDVAEPDLGKMLDLNGEWISEPDGLSLLPALN